MKKTTIVQTTPTKPTSSFKFHASPPHPIMLAVGKGELDTVKKILESKPELISTTSKCMNMILTPNIECDISLLDLAAGLGKTEVLSFLLAQKHAFKLENALYFAAQNGHLGSVKILLNNKIDITHEKYKALRISATQSHLEIAEYIVNHIQFDRALCRKALDKQKDEKLLILLLKPEQKQVTNKKQEFIKACKDFNQELMTQILSNNEIVLANNPEIFWDVWNLYEQWDSNDKKTLTTLFEIFNKQPSFKDLLQVLWHDAFTVNKQKILLCKLIASHIPDHTMILIDFVKLCQNRNYKLLEILIDNEIVNLKAENGLALIAASLYLEEYYHESSCLKIINLLLQKGSNLCDQNYKAIIAAFCEGNFETARTLINYKLSNLSDNDFELIFKLANSFKKSMDITTDNNQIAIKEIVVDTKSTYKQEEFFEKLLNVEQLARNNLFASACEKQNEQIVSIMLKKEYIGFSNGKYKFLIDPRENSFTAALLVFKHFTELNALNKITSYLKEVWDMSPELLFELICKAGNHAFYKIWISNNDNRAKIKSPNASDALSSASKLGHIDIVRELLKLPVVDPTSDNNKAIQNAIEGDHNDILDCLLTHPKCTLKTTQFAITTACKKSNVPVITKLIQTKNLDLTFNDNFLIRQAAQYGWDEIFQILFNNRFIDITANNNEPIRLSCEHNHTNIVKMLLSRPDVNPSIEDNICIYHACNNGNLEMVQLLLAERITLIGKTQDQNGTNAFLEPLTQQLLAQYRVDPSAKDNRALIVTCEKGYDNILQELLKDKRVKPGQNSAAFTKACTNNYPKVVTILLEYKLEVATTTDLEAVRIAYNKNHFKIIEIILNSDKIPNPLIGFSDHWLLQTACEKGHTAAVTTLLKKIQIIPDNVQQNSLTNALNGNHIQVFKLLLEDYRFDPTFANNALIQNASKNNKPAFVKLLMDDGRADPTDNAYEAICEAYSKNYHEVFEQLILHKNVDLTFNNNWLICAAAVINDIAWVQRLLKNPEVNPTNKKNCALKAAYIHKNKEIFEQLFADKRSNVYFENNWLLCEAAKLNDKPLVENLLKNDEIESPDICSALKGAYTNNHQEICALLLNDKRINPAFEDNWLLTEASGKNDVHLVKKLLEDKRVEKSSQIPAIENAYKNGHFDIIDVIIENKDHEFLASIFEKSCEKNYVKIVKQLLLNPKFDPSYTDNLPIRLACKMGREEIAKLLLLHEKVDPSAKKNEAIREVCNNGYLSLLEELLKEEKVNPADCDQEAICKAIKNSHNHIISRLLLERRVSLYATTASQSTPLEDILKGKDANIIRPKILITLKNIGLHFGLLSDKLKREILLELLSYYESTLANSKIMIPFKDGNTISTITSIEELKNSWSRFDTQDLMLLYAGMQKLFWEMSFTGYCSNENAKLTLQIEEKLALSFVSFYEAEKKKHKNEQQGTVSAYRALVDLTEQLRSVNPNFYFDWLCRLGSDYMNAISTEHSGETYEDDAIDTFKVVYQECAHFISCSTLYILSINSNPKVTQEQLPIAYTLVKHIQYMLNDSIQHLEKAIMGIVSAVQKKMKVSHNIQTNLPEFNPETNLVFLKEILNVFDKFADMKEQSSLVHSCLQRILSPFFINYLAKSIPDTTRESFEKLSFLKLIDVFQKVHPNISLSKQEEETKTFMPQYQQALQQDHKTEEKSETSLQQTKISFN